MPRKPTGAARTEILHVRLAPPERERLRRVAAREYDDESSFARRAILQALDRAEAAGEAAGGTASDAQAVGRPAGHPAADATRDRGSD